MYNIRIGQNTRFSYWALPLGFLALIGGSIQYAGLLSLTQSNLLVLVLFFPALILRRAGSELRKEWPLLILSLYAVVVGIIRGTDSVAIATYLYYVCCTITAAVTARVVCARAFASVSKKNVLRSFFRLTKIFLAIQVGACLLQRIFVQQVAAHAPIPILHEDAVFGTLFFKSDASLAAISEILMVGAFVIPSRFRDKALISLFALLVIFLGGSKAGQAVVLIVTIATFARYLYIKLRLARSGLKHLAIAAVVVTAIFFFQVGEKAASEFVDFTVHAYEGRFSWDTAGRFAPIGQMFSEGLKFFGDGPLTYYNPLTKTWLYDAGFSTFYSLYIDLGVVGLLLYVLYYARVIWSSTRNLFVSLVFASIVVSFSAFNLTLSDIAFAFVINFVLRLHQVSRVADAGKGLAT